MKHYYHLNTQERAILLLKLEAGMSLRQIAKQLNRAPSTLSRELRRNTMQKHNYNAVDADMAYQARRSHCVKPHKLQAGSILYDRVYRDLTQYKWSPEQISAKLKRDYPNQVHMQLSHETLYAYIYAHPKGKLRKFFVSNLRRSKSKRGQRGSSTSNYSSLKIAPEQMIGQRPENINSRQIAGHWEGDLVVGAMNQSCVGTLVERKTGFVVICKMRNKSADAVREGFEINMQTLPAFLRLSMTYDRGAEMSQHPIMSKNLDMKIYFADRNAPWQRGSSENINGLIRQFLPKGKDLSIYSQAGLDEIAHLLNSRPRKRFDFRSPQEMMEKELPGGLISVALDS